MSQVRSEIRSMTGFASLRGQAGAFGFTLTVKSVNHRHLDLVVRVPMGFEAFEAALRRTLKERLRRGHVELALQLDKTFSTGCAELNEPLLATYVGLYRRAAQLHGLSSEPDVNELLRWPGVLSAETTVLRVDESELAPAVHAAMEDLIARFDGVRAGEGAALAAELRASMQRVQTFAEEIAQLRATVPEFQFQRLRARLAELLEGSGAQVAEDRILMEAAVLAERGDVEEELVRLRTHVGRFLDLLAGGGEVGRQLDFLLQELNREANTLLSKTGASAGDSGMRITELGLQVKVELERAREQVQNLE